MSLIMFKTTAGVAMCISESILRNEPEQILKPEVEADEAD